MALSEYASINGLTISTSEISIISGTTTLQTSTDDGVYQLWVDGIAAGMVKGDEFEIKIKEKVNSSTAQRTVFSARLSDAQSEPWVSPFLQLMHGWDMTLIKIAGTDRGFAASIRRVN